MSRKEYEKIFREMSNETLIRRSKSPHLKKDALKEIARRKKAGTMKQSAGKKKKSRSGGTIFDMMRSM